MTAGTITILVEAARWTEAEVDAVDAAERVATWREADREAHDGSTQVSLDVKASSAVEGCREVRAVLGYLPPDAFKASTA